MAIRITHIRLSGGDGHEHITYLKWTKVGAESTGESSKATIVSWIEDERGVAYVQQPGTSRVTVGVIDPDRGEKYLRTYADGSWNNNLLSLPRF